MRYTISMQFFILRYSVAHSVVAETPGGGGTSYNGLYGEAPPERGTLFKLAVHKRVEISRVGVWKRGGKTDF